MPGGGVKMGRQRRHEAWRSGGCSSRAFGISGVRGWGVGFWVVAASEWGEVLGFAVAGGWVPQRWVLILWVLAAGEWWVLCGSFFFGIGKQLNGNFLGPSRKNDKDNSLVEKTQWRGIFFFFLWWFFSSSRLIAGCFRLDRSMFTLIPKLTQDNQNKIERTEK